MRLTGYLVIGLLWALSIASAQDSSSSIPPLEVMRGSYVYDFQDQLIHVYSDERGDPTVSLGEQTITAESIFYYQKTNTIEATGNVRLWYEGTILEGNKLTFDISKEQGTMEKVKDAEVSKGVYFSGETLTFRQVLAEPVKGATEPVTRNEYTLTNGIITACELPFPHYHIECDRVVIIPDERAWANDIVFRIGTFSLFYFPVFTKSLKEHEITYFFTPAVYSHLGVGFFNRLMYKPNENYIFNLYGDYFTDAGFGKGAKFTFDVPGPYGPRGELYGYHILQEAPDNDYIFDGEDRYNIAGHYQQTLPYDVQVTARGHILSDSEYRHDDSGAEQLHGLDVFEEEQDVVSYLNIAKAWEDQSIRLTTASRLDSFYFNGLPFVERKPQLHYVYYPSRILDSDFMFDFELDYGRYRREEGITYPFNKVSMFQQTRYLDEMDRFDARFELSRTIHLPEQFALKPWVAYRATHYADAVHYGDNPGDPATRLDRFDYGSETRSMLEGGAELSTRRTMEFDPFLKRYDKMRAVLEPVLQYGYFHPDVALEEFGLAPHERFPYIDISDDYRAKMHRVSTLLRTRIEGKDSSGTTSELLRFGLGLSYDQFPDENLRFDNFEFYEDLAKDNDHRFSDVIEEFAISPLSWLSLGNTMRYDVEDSEMRSAYYYTNLRPLNTVDLNVGYYTYRYPFINANEQEDISMLLHWAVSPKWDLFLNTRFDLDQNVFRWNRLGVVRDMHDFYTVFQIEHESHPTLGDDYSFQFRVNFWGIGGRKGRAPEVN
ncbi:MAG: LPS assembly protein LptD [bacterium]|nr:LPS assembly protein LptD [bacterium]